MSEMQRIGVTNQKGGVAKTTNTVNVAGALAHRGHDVLAVDADPQGYLTNELGFETAYTSDGTTFYDAFKEPTDVPLSEVIVEGPEFDVVPSNIDLFRLEQDLIASGWRVRERLSMLFDDLDGYDYVIVDAPPSLGPINDNVLLATENILIPVQAEETSELALTHLFNQIGTIEDRYQTTITELGIIISNVEHPIDNDERSVIHGFARDFRESCPVYEVRNRAAVKRSDGSLFGPGSVQCDQAYVYERIAADLEARHE